MRPPGWVWAHGGVWVSWLDCAVLPVCRTGLQVRDEASRLFQRQLRPFAQWMMTAARNKLCCSPCRLKLDSASLVVQGAVPCFFSDSLMLFLYVKVPEGMWWPELTHVLMTLLRRCPAGYPAALQRHRQWNWPAANRYVQINPVIAMEKNLALMRNKGH